jgi:ribose transport system permease protein
MSYVKKVFSLAAKQKAITAIIIIFIFMMFFDTPFYTSRNMLQILNSGAVNGILAAGVTLVLISFGSDLSVGSTMALSGIIAVKLSNMNIPIIPAILCALAAGAFIGFINGFFVVHQKTEPFIITLGMGMAILGVGQIITDAQPVSAKNEKFMEISNGMLFGVIPNLVVFMVIVLLALHIILRYTQFGRNIYAVGGDYEVAAYSGINARKIKWLAFVICGVTAALGGVLNSSYLNTGNSIYGASSPLLVHCAAVIGGTSLMGGIGGIPQTTIGLLALIVLQNALNILGVSSYLQLLFQGLAIFAILWMNSFSIKRKRETV